MREEIFFCKEFIKKPLTGLAGICLVSNHINGVFSSVPEVPEIRSLLKTGIMITHLSIGALKTNEESFFGNLSTG